jgi:hypothetical protein
MGIPPEIPTWGNIMAEGRTLFRVFPHNILYPGIFLTLTVLAINIWATVCATRSTRDEARKSDGDRNQATRPRGPRTSASRCPRAATGSTPSQKVSFTGRPGEIVCLVGESGSGKSVIAFTAMGLLPKNAAGRPGEILLQGERHLVGASEDRLRELRCTRMSMIFQEPMTALNPVMTCGDQIDEVLREHTTQLSPAERKAKIIAMIEQVQLPDRSACTPPTRTSCRAASASAS